jgi:NACalpha-BTF3-like transcription factor
MSTIPKFLNETNNNNILIFTDRDEFEAKEKLLEIAYDKVKDQYKDLNKDDILIVIKNTDATFEQAANALRKFKNSPSDVVDSILELTPI